MRALETIVVTSARSAGSLLERTLFVHRHQNQGDFLAVVASQPIVEWCAPDQPRALLGILMEDALNKPAIDM